MSGYNGSFATMNLHSMRHMSSCNSSQPKGKLGMDFSLPSYRYFPFNERHDFDKSYFFSKFYHQAKFNLLEIVVLGTHFDSPPGDGRFPSAVI